MHRQRLSAEAASRACPVRLRKAPIGFFGRVDAFALGLEVLPGVSALLCFPLL